MAEPHVVRVVALGGQVDPARHGRVPDGHDGVLTARQVGEGVLPVAAGGRDADHVSGGVEQHDASVGNRAVSLGPDRAADPDAGQQFDLLAGLAAPDLDRHCGRTVRGGADRKRVGPVGHRGEGEAAGGIGRAGGDDLTAYVRQDNHRALDRCAVHAAHGADQAAGTGEHQVEVDRLVTDHERRGLRVVVTRRADQHIGAPAGGRQVVPSVGVRGRAADLVPPHIDQRERGVVHRDARCWSAADRAGGAGLVMSRSVGWSGSRGWWCTPPR